MKRSIALFRTDPMVVAAANNDSTTLKEVGFIPGDKHGCKIYGGRNARGRTYLVGIHSPSYGCHKEPTEVPVRLSTQR